MYEKQKKLHNNDKNILFIHTEDDLKLYLTPTQETVPDNQPTIEDDENDSDTIHLYLPPTQETNDVPSEPMAIGNDESDHAGDESFLCKYTLYD